MYFNLSIAFLLSCWFQNALGQSVEMPGGLDGNICCFYYPSRWTNGPAPLN